MIREVVGVTQRDLAEKIGASYNKIHTLEQGITRMLVSELYEIGQALNIQPLTLLQDAPPLADVHTFLKIAFPDLAQESGQAIDEMECLVKWSERRWRMKANMFYCPIYYRGPSSKVIEFDQYWTHSVLTKDMPHLYIEAREGGFLGRFFESEIMPASSPLDHDKPSSTANTAWWETEEQISQFLKANGYCWRRYPGMAHIDEYCQEPNEPRQD